MESLERVLEAIEGFQWDAGNSDKNWRHHNVTQLECEQVFFNLPLVVAADLKHSAEEIRFFPLGCTDAWREITLVFTVRSRHVRVISARPMSRRERKEYAHAQAEKV